MTQAEFYAGFQTVLDAAEVEHFTARVDFECRRGLASVPPARLWGRMLPTVRIAERARRALGAPLVVNSAYREPAYNRRIGGAKHSLHMEFNALDLSPRGVSPRELYEFMVAQPEAGRMGVGLYATFVHIDTRGYEARW